MRDMSAPYYIKILSLFCSVGDQKFKQGFHFPQPNKPYFQKCCFAPNLEEHNSANIGTRVKRKPILETTDSLLLMHNLHYANFKSRKISKCPPASPLCATRLIRGIPARLASKQATTVGWQADVWKFCDF